MSTVLTPAPRCNGYENGDDFADRGPIASDLPGPVAGVCTPAEWLEMQAAWFRLFETPWADRLAVHIQSLADDARFVGADVPTDLDIRLNLLSRTELCLEDMALLVRSARR